jgi:uncharacterized protein
MGEIVEKVRKFVEEECKKPNANYPTAYKDHFIPVHNYARQLAEKLGADTEIVEISAWLHDIGSILYERKNHHITSAEIAEKKLKEFGYLEDKIKKVKKCILNHRGSVNNNKKTLEEQIIADADSLSHFDSLGGLFHAAFICEKLNLEDAQKSVLEKLERSWNKITLEESRKLIKPKYDAAMLLLREK